MDGSAVVSMISVLKINMLLVNIIKYYKIFFLKTVIEHHLELQEMLDLIPIIVDAIL